MGSVHFLLTSTAISNYSHAQSAIQDSEGGDGFAVPSVVMIASSLEG